MVKEKIDLRGVRKSFGLGLKVLALAGCGMIVQLSLGAQYETAKGGEKQDLVQWKMVIEKLGKIVMQG